MQKIILASRGRYRTLLSRTLRWHYLYFLKKKRSPLCSVLYITSRCNFRCGMCNIRNNEAPLTIDIKTYEYLVDSLAKEGCYYMSIAGGEPLLLDDIIHRLEYARRRIPYLHLVTNGYLLDGNMAKEIGRIGIDDVSISIDGMAAYHDGVRGVKGAFDRALSAIDNLKKYSPETAIVINSFLSESNIPDLEELVLHVSKMDVGHKFQPLDEHQRRLSGPMDRLESNSCRQIVGFLERTKKNRNIMNSPAFIRMMQDFFSGKGPSGITARKCKLGYFYCEVKEDSRLYPCMMGMGWKNGFAIDDGFNKAYYGRGYTDTLSELEDCRLCGKNIYICYLEPRISFPVFNFLRYNIAGGIRD